MRLFSSGWPSSTPESITADADRERAAWRASKVSNAWSRPRYHCARRSGSFGVEVTARRPSRRRQSRAPRPPAGASRRHHRQHRREPGREALAGDHARAIGARAQVDRRLERAVGGDVRRRDGRPGARAALRAAPAPRAPGEQRLDEPGDGRPVARGGQPDGRRDRERARRCCARSPTRCGSRSSPSARASPTTWPPRDFSTREPLPLRRRRAATRASRAGSRARGRRGGPACRTRPCRRAASGSSVPIVNHVERSPSAARTVEPVIVRLPFEPTSVTERTRPSAPVGVCGRRAAARASPAACRAAARRTAAGPSRGRARACRRVGHGDEIRASASSPTRPGRSPSGRPSSRRRTSRQARPCRARPGPRCR